jgi:hypothetical protein
MHKIQSLDTVPSKDLKKVLKMKPIFFFCYLAVNSSTWNQHKKGRAYMYGPPVDIYTGRKKS